MGDSPKSARRSNSKGRMQGSKVIQPTGGKQRKSEEGSGQLLVRQSSGPLSTKSSPSGSPSRAHPGKSNDLSRPGSPRMSGAGEKKRPKHLETKSSGSMGKIQPLGSPRQHAHELVDDNDPPPLQLEKKESNGTGTNGVGDKNTPPHSPRSSCSHGSEPGTDQVSVCVRMRPLNEEERTHGQEEVWNYDDDSISPVPTNTLTTQRYTFDHVFGSDSTVKTIYDRNVKNIVDSAMEGISGTIFAYGQTSSGKTYTMLGTANEPGVLPMAVSEIFAHIQKNKDREYFLRASYIEIYNEVIRDLLDPESPELKIYDTSRGAMLKDVREEVVVTPDQLMGLISRGEETRKFSATLKNALSSRSHTIFKIIIESRHRPENDVLRSADVSPEILNTTLEECIGGVRVSHLELADLAGSERSTFVGVDTKTKTQETKNINKSLFTLTQCITKLSKGAKQSFVPYRESKLTRLLMPALGGHAKATIICAVSPARIHCEETLTTLTFANNAKNINNKPTVNVVQDDSSDIYERGREIYDLKYRLAVYDANVKKAHEGEDGSVSLENVDPTNVLLKRKIRDAQILKSQLEEKTNWIDQLLVHSGSQGLDVRDPDGLKFLKKRYMGVKELKDRNGTFKPKDEHYYIMLEKTKILEDEMRKKDEHADELTQLFEEFRNSELELRRRINDLERDVADRDQEIAQYQDKLKGAGEEKVDQQRVIDDLYTRLQDKDGEIKEEVGKQTKIQKDLRGRLRDANQDIDFLKSDVEAQRRETMKARERVSQLEEEIQHQEDYVQMVDQKVAPLESLLEESNKHIELLTDELHVVKRYMKEKDELSTILLSQLNKLKADLKAKDMNMDNIGARLKLARAEVRPVEAKLKSLLGSISSTLEG
eukprot:GFYU01007344.1.p1 GENE.GFYU01007344.1~~GFYU01007344.1.p1  ORF type:complete len:881 (-),score=262.75 GFYU01007344.1:121-2763(-)